VHSLFRVLVPLTLLSALAAPLQGIPSSASPSDIKVGGYLGQRLAGCLEHNVKTTDGQYLTAVFRSKQETRTWQTEFWGKWMHSAVPLYRYSQDPALRANLDASVKTLLSTQRADGYIGNYTEAAQLGGPWDIWGRKYTMLGLLQYYDLTHDQAVLTAARRVADHLMTQVGPGKKDIYKVGAYHGMASCSVLEPILGLHRLTGEAKYLEFARYLVSQLEDPVDSAKLVSKALAGVDVGNRFPHPKSWWTWDNGMKAYEMMSCYQGLLDYYQATGDKQYLDATVAVAQNIIATEINAAGSGAAFECWYHGGARETEPAFHMMETCVTTTWLRLCESLLRLTGDPRYADQIERTLYNAFLASLARDDSTFSKYCPLEGMRGRGEDQCRMTTNCCIANGPRGFVALLDTLIMAEGDTLLVNLYTDSRVAITLPSNHSIVTVTQQTDYPVGDTVVLTVSPDRATAFTLKLRIPAWGATTVVMPDGKPVANVKPGAYLPITRTWQAGDTLQVKFDLGGRGRIKDNHLVIERGPIVLTRDARLSKDNIHDVVHAPDLSKPIKLTPLASRDPAIWMTFSAELRQGLNLETEEGKKARPVAFCDFASAGNTWHEDSLYRVWQRLPLNVTKAPYVPYNPPN